MILKEIQAIGRHAVQQVIDQHHGFMNIQFQASTLPTGDSSFLEIVIANNDGTNQKVYDWGILSFNDYQLTAFDLQHMLEVFVDRCVRDFWSKKNNDLAMLAKWRGRIPSVIKLK